MLIPLNGVVTLRDVVECPELLPSVLIPVYKEIAEGEKAKADAVYDYNRAVAIRDKLNKLKGL